MNPADPGRGDFGAPVWARFVRGVRNDPGDQGREASGQRPRASGWTAPKGSPIPPPPPNAVPGCPLPFDWESRGYLALDFETTGLDASSGRIIETGALRFSFDPEGALVIEDEWSSLVNPGVPIPDEATAVHGITDLEVSGAPFFGDIVSTLIERMTGRVIVAHNAPFDIGFLQAELRRLSIAEPDLEIADTLALSRIAFPAFSRFSLGVLAFRLGIDTGSSHRALDDARACMHLFARAARALAGACP